jgi:hypothetical protein
VADFTPKTKTDPVEVEVGYPFKLTVGYSYVDDSGDKLHPASAKKASLAEF